MRNIRLIGALLLLVVSYSATSATTYVFSGTIVESYWTFRDENGTSTGLFRDVPIGATFTGELFYNQPPYSDENDVDSWMLFKVGGTYFGAYGGRISSFHNDSIAPGISYSGREDHSSASLSLRFQENTTVTPIPNELDLAAWMSGSVRESTSGYSCCYDYEGAIVGEITHISEIPLPTAAWLFGSALLGLGAIKHRKT